MTEITPPILKSNLKRVDSLIENSYKLCPCCNNPIPSWIEISPIDFCNRHCSFCPKGNDTISPSQKHLFMPTALIQKIAKDLSEIEFKGTIVLAGYGEPMTAPNIMEFIRLLSSICRVEIVTNGDLLTVEKISQMISLGISFISISLYTGPNQIDHFKKMFTMASTSTDNYILRDRWYESDKDFGIKLTNRAGLINIGDQPEVNQNVQCFYPHYSMTIDWNGDVLLCPQDWHRRIKFGNLSYTSIHDIWMGSFYKKYRNSLFKGNRSLFPCYECNCTGTLHGKAHAEKWHEN